MKEWEFKLMDYVEGKLPEKEQKQWARSTFESKKKLSEAIHLKRDLFLLETLDLEPIPKPLWQKTFVHKGPPRIVLELLENSFHLIENTFTSSVHKEVLSYREEFYEVERVLFSSQNIDLLLIPLSQNTFSLEIRIHPKETDMKTYSKLQLFELQKELGMQKMQKIKKPDSSKDSLQDSSQEGRMIASFKTPEKHIQIRNIPQGDYLLKIDRENLHIHIHSKKS